MKTIGFVISRKENEKRRAIVPTELEKIKDANRYFFFEEGYGDVLGLSDNDYAKFGAKIVDRATVMKQDIIVDPKVGDGEYLDSLKGQAIFGWIHATQNKGIRDKIVENKLTAIAWEKMFEEGRHVFWRNNELAGEAAIMHAFSCYGKMPYDTTVAVIGSGNVARGAIKVLNMLGAKVYQYNRKTEGLFRDELGNFDVVVNAVLWDVMRKDHIISRSDLKRLKKNSMIIDVSCDKNGGIETSIPTTIENPTYVVDGVLHYVVDHTPSIFFKTFSEDNSKIIYPYLSKMVFEESDAVLEQATIIRDGIILDEEIIDYAKKMEAI